MAHFLGDYFSGNFVWFSSLVGRSGGSRSSPALGGGMPGHRAESTDRRPVRWMGSPDRAENGVPGEGIPVCFGASRRGRDFLLRSNLASRRETLTIGSSDGCGEGR